MNHRDRKTFILYKSFYDPIVELSDEDKGQLFDAIFQYNLGLDVRELSPTCKIAFAFMKSHFDRDAKAYEEKCNRNKINGSKGGRPRKESKDVEEKPTGFFQNPNDNDNNYENINDNNNKDVDSISEPRFIPPTLTEIEEYCLDKALDVKPDSFFDYYSSIGWKVGNNSMVDWKAALRRWNSKESEFKQRIGQDRRNNQQDKKDEKSWNRASTDEEFEDVSFLYEN